MEHDHNTDHQHRQPLIKTYLPLIGVFLIIITWTIIAQIFIHNRFDLKEAMSDFMGMFFLIFGTLQLINLKKFAESFAAYDLLAQKSRLYAKLFPFVELALAAAYLSRNWLTLANIIVLILFGIASIGVAKALKSSKGIPCACLGGIFVFPLSTITLLEDLLMVAMAAFMLNLTN
jgi:hypothetical protein